MLWNEFGFPHERGRTHSSQIHWNRKTNLMIAIELLKTSLCPPTLKLLFTFSVSSPATATKKHTRSKSNWKRNYQQIVLHYIKFSSLCSTCRTMMFRFSIGFIQLNAQNSFGWICVGSRLRTVGKVYFRIIIAVFRLLELSDSLSLSVRHTNALYACFSFSYVLIDTSVLDCACIFPMLCSIERYESTQLHSSLSENETSS